MIEATLTMAPPPWASIWRAAAQAHRKTAVWFKSMTRSHSARGISSAGMRAPAAGVVDQHVEPAVPAGDRVHDPADGGLVRHVEGLHLGAHPLGPDRPGDGFGRVGLDFGDDGHGTSAREGDCRGPAEAVAPARHHRHLAIKGKLSA